MNLLKTAVATTALALTLGSYPASAEICLGMACMYNKMTPMQGIDAVVVQVNEALKAINDQAGEDAVSDNIKEALAGSKEINANDKVDRNRNRANDYLKKARTSLKEGDTAQATAHLNEAKKRFIELKGMIDLSQADRTAQQTPMLNRILNKPDR